MTYNCKHIFDKYSVISVTEDPQLEVLVDLIHGFPYMDINDWKELFDNGWREYPNACPGTYIWIHYPFLSLYGKK